MDKDEIKLNDDYESMTSKNGWEKKLVEELAMATLKERRTTRRWGIFFKLAFLSYVVALLVLIYFPFDPMSLDKGSDEHTAVINVEGVISSESKASADYIITALRDAFEDEKTKGVILRMNTPGGSPVQSAYINDEIYRLKALYPETKVYAVIVDVCASGGYYIAAAADEIYADKGSMVGSIGVLMNSFGFENAIDKLGVTRRMYTAGEHKGFLDPFTKPQDSDIVHAKSMLANIHKQFVDVVKKGRGDKLKDDPLLFSGYVWTGEQSLELGLVDKLGSSSHVAREVIGAEEIKDFTISEAFIDRFAKKMGAAMASTMAEISGFGLGPQLR
ncbi:MAG: S49 family peptidase [Gammaproteobacteria bacterium]|nr:S49 family peptidase [Gammaproteobacteria bacterium]